MMKVSLMEHREKDNPSRKFETFDGIALNLLLNMNGATETARSRHQRRRERSAPGNVNSSKNTRSYEYHSLQH
jgi:hypothetical protein